MKTVVRLLALSAALGVALAVSAADSIAYRAKPGSKMKIEGTSTIHDWTAESGLVSGRLELPANFPTDPSSKELQPGKVDAKAQVTILVRTFKCSSGSAMDAVMQEAMDAKNHPKIEYQLKELTFKEFKDSVMVFDSTGEVTVHGQTKPVSMPVEITRVDASNLKVAGSVGVKMTDFGIQPPAPKIALGAIKTGDEVKLVFEWNVAKAAAAAASAGAP